jgi:hypothetical protein
VTACGARPRSPALPVVDFACSARRSKTQRGDIRKQVVLQEAQETDFPKENMEETTDVFSSISWTKWY